MTLTLTYVQRLNVSALLGVQPAVVGEMRAYWALQDKLDLTEYEAKAVGLVKGDTVRWDTTKDIPTVILEFSDRELQMMRKAVTGSAMLAPGQRSWLEPLLEMLEPKET